MFRVTILLASIGIVLQLSAGDLTDICPAVPKLAHMCRMVNNKTLKAICLKAIQFPGKLALNTNLSSDVQLMLKKQQELLDQQLAEVLKPQTNDAQDGLNNFDTIMRLLAQGANPSCCNLEEETALHRAAMHNQAERIEAMVRHGCQLDTVDILGATPVHLASKKGHLETLQKLLVAGAKCGMPDVEGNTPLHLAAVGDHSTCVSALAAKGAPRGIKNNDDKTPLDLACQYGFTDSAQILKYYQECNNE